MKKVIALFLVVVLMLLNLVGCGSNSNEAGSEGVNQEKELLIGLSMNTLNNPFFVAVKEGAEKKAQEEGIKLTVTDAQNSPEKQITDIENLLQQGIDILVIDPTDSDAIVPAVLEANNANVPVVTIDRESNGGDVVTHIGFDAIKSGRIAGQFLVDTLDGEGNIVEILGIMGTNVARDRSAGFNEIMKENPGMKTIAQQTANFDRAEAMSVMENILQAHSKIDGIYAANDEMALGALAAIEGAGRLDEIVLIGCDAIDPALDAIKSGSMEATIAEPPFFLGKAGIDAAIGVYNGKSYDPVILLDNELVTPDNVNQIKTRD